MCGRTEHRPRGRSVAVVHTVGAGVARAARECGQARSLGLNAASCARYNVGCMRVEGERVGGERERADRDE